MKIELVNFCGECGHEFDAECDERDFWAHKIGRMKCPECGRDVMPCDVCAECLPESEQTCDNCPWKNAEYINNHNERS